MEESARISLVKVYKDSEDFRKYVKTLLSLSFFPIKDVYEGFDLIIENCPKEMDPLISYWEDTYIGRIRRNRRTTPIFDIQIWNNFSRVNNSLPRMNNSVEAWHNAFQHSINCKHPSVYKLIKHFRCEQNHVEIQVARIKSGILPQSN